MNRRDQIIEEIKKHNKPLSATSLAKKMGVSRQIIVGDVALIRASGIHIIATPRGYILEQPNLDNRYILAVKHSHHQLEDELYTIVDLGGTIEDVIVDHPLYGQLTGELHLSSRYDVQEFLKRMHHDQVKPLSHLTNGLHLHTIRCQSEDVYQRIINALDEKGYLFTKKES